MEAQRSVQIAQNRNRPGASPSLHGILIGAALLCILLAGLHAGDVRAESPRLAQSAIEPATMDPPPATLYLPQIALAGPITPGIGSGACPSVSTAEFAAVPVIGPPAGHPPQIHADLNLAVRSYVTTTAPLTLIEINGPTDGDAPQLASLFANQPRPEFVEAFQVNGWDWACEDSPDAAWHGHGCRTAPISDPPVTLLAMASARGEPVLTPYRRAEVYPTRVVALALYAEETRITLAFTREDSPAVGYVVHVEDICVDPNLLALYRALDAAGRTSLPGLHSIQQLGVASGPAIKVAVRDTGSFMDPRSRKDWWQSD